MVPGVAHCVSFVIILSEHAAAISTSLFVGVAIEYLVALLFGWFEVMQPSADKSLKSLFFCVQTHMSSHVDTNPSNVIHVLSDGWLKHQTVGFASP